MEEEVKAKTVVFITIVVAIIGISVGVYVDLKAKAEVRYWEGYKKGQIDALSKDRIQYQLVSHADSTRSWEHISSIVKIGKNE